MLNNGKIVECMHCGGYRYADDEEVFKVKDKDGEEGYLCWNCHEYRHDGYEDIKEDEDVSEE